MSTKAQKHITIRSRENTGATLKYRGAGDGVKTPGFKTERVPVPSSRKFTARLTKDHSTQLKLKQVLEDIESKHGKLQKSKSVAEITPSKNKIKIPKLQAGASAITLLATPRPLFADVNALASQKSEEKEWRLQQLGCRRFLVFAWRRNRIRCMRLSETLKGRQDHIFQLEQQINCLKNLTQSECLKRTEASNDCLFLKNTLEAVESANKRLSEDKGMMEEELAKVKESLRQCGIDLENSRNLVNSKNININNLSKQLYEERIAAEILQDAQEISNAKIEAQENVITVHEDTIEKLEKTLQLANEQLKNSQALKKSQMEDFNELQEQYRQESCRNNSLNNELNQLYVSIGNMESTIGDLEKKLLDTQEEFKKVSDENKVLKRDLGKFECDRRNWWKNAKDFAVVSWSVLNYAAYLTLPAKQRP